ncbi:MAG: aldo/keto reductase [candidate division Zixibacteria bacterium]|nr:aldo/keto reductase [candidate division Zixibacteria bacterium]
MVSPIGLGCWQFSKGKGLGGKFWPVLEDDEIENIVKVSLEGGVNWFDTAENYGGGESERALSKALKNLGKSPGEVIIATKWWPLFRTAKSIIRTIDRRLSALGGFPIDLYQIHWPYSFSSTTAQMKAMAELVKQGKIRHVGVSNFSAEKMRIAQQELSRQGVDLISNQVQYSLLNRKIETNGVLEMARELGISIIAYSPLAQGLLTGKFHDNPDLIKNRAGFRKYTGAFKQNGLERSRPVMEVLRELAAKYQVSASQVALNWVINSHREIVVAIPGATKASHAEDNVGSMRFKLTRDELNRLDKVSSAFRN